MFGGQMVGLNFSRWRKIPHATSSDEVHAQPSLNGIRGGKAIRNQIKCVEGACWLSAVNQKHQQCPSSPLFGGEPHFSGTPKNGGLVPQLADIQTKTPCFLGWKNWLERELNPRHEDFQSSALPTELSSRANGDYAEEFPFLQEVIHEVFWTKRTVLCFFLHRCPVNAQDDGLLAGLSSPETRLHAHHQILPL